MSVIIKKSDATSALSLTPLIDVVFLLLIFFLVTTRFAQEDPRMPIVLPSATTATPMIEEPREVVIDIDEEGQYMMDSDLLDEEGIERRLAEAVASNPVRQTVVIRADRRVPFQSVVTAMDICNRTGVAEYSVTTQEGPDAY